MNKKVINKYFREFIINHKEVMEQDEHSLLIINEIENAADVEFDSNWNYLMLLVLIIEHYFDVQKIITHDNYVGFEFKQQNTVQDKGLTKFEALYLVCFKTLQKYWLDGKTTEDYGFTEPFDEEDLK